MSTERAGLLGADEPLRSAVHRRPKSSAESRPLWRPFLSVCVIAALFYLWTVNSSETRFNFGAPQNDYYNQLTDGFLKGELSLPTLPPAGLLALSNPYSPQLNAGYSQFHDLALYHGHFFLTWGPTPVITLFLPWRLLHVGAIPQSFALWIYCTTGLGFALLLLRFLARQYFPSIRTWQLVVASTALASCNIAPFLLRSPLVYEVNIGSSYCFAMAGIYLLVSGGLARTTSGWRIAVGSLCLGLSAGGHQDNAVLGVFLCFFVLILWHVHGARSLRERIRWLPSVFGPFVVVILLLLVYNQARFGSPLELGTRYILAIYNPATAPTFRLSYLEPNGYYYLIAPVRWVLSFPFFQLPPPPAYPAALPAGYLTQTEVMGGIFVTTPIVLCLGAFPHLVRRRRLPRELLWVIAALAVTAFAAVFAVGFGIPGGSYRYEADFASFFLLAAVLVWFALCERAPHKRRRVAKILGSAVVTYGVLVGVAISLTGYYNDLPRLYPELETSDPSVYWALDKLTSPIPTLYTLIVGHPILTKVTSPLGVSARANYSTIGAGTKLFFYLNPQATNVEVIAPRSEWYGLTGGFGTGPDLGTGAHAIVSVMADGTTRRYGLRPGLMTFPVHLHTGLNRIELTARPSTGKALDPLAAVAQVYQFALSKQD